MARERIAPGSFGDVALVPLGLPTDDPDLGEVVIPSPVTAAGEPSSLPKGLKRDSLVSVRAAWDAPLLEYRVTRWRGLARVRDVDGTTAMVRRWRDTKAAAADATREAARAWLADRARERASAAAPDGTTCRDLLVQYRHVVQDPSTTMHARTRTDYEYSISGLLGEPLAPLKDGRARNAASRDGLATAFAAIADLRPADVTPAAAKGLLRDVAGTNGPASATRVRSILSNVWRIAIDRELVMINTWQAIKGTRSEPLIPAARKRETGLDPRRSPSPEDVAALLEGLRADPEAQPMDPNGPRNKSRHGRAGTAPANGKDVHGIAVMLMSTGARIGEVSALRWQDIDLTEGHASVKYSGTLVWTPGQGAHRQDFTKTASGDGRKDAGARTIHLPSSAAQMLRERVQFFGLDLANPEHLARPVFGSPAKPEQWRDPANRDAAIRKLFDRYGITWARGHAGRKHVVNSLLREGVSVAEVAKVVGWSDVATVSKYADTKSPAAAATAAALDRIAPG